LKEKGIIRHGDRALRRHGESLESTAKKRMALYLQRHDACALIIRLPEQLPRQLPEKPRRAHCQSGSLVDLMPTVLDAVGLPVHRRCKEAACFATFVPTLRPGCSSDRERALYGETSCREFTSIGVSCAPRRTPNITSSTRRAPSSTIWRRIRAKFTIYSPTRRQ